MEERNINGNRSADERYCAAKELRYVIGNMCDVSLADLGLCEENDISDIRWLKDMWNKIKNRCLSPKSYKQAKKSFFNESLVRLLHSYDGPFFRGIKVICDDRFGKWHEIMCCREVAEVAVAAFVKLAQDGYVKAYPYAALAYMGRDNDKFEHYGLLSLGNEGCNWIGEQLGDYYSELSQYATAAKCYEMAFDSDCRSDVAYKLGVMYEEGKGVERNIERAKELYKISIAGDDSFYPENSEAYRRFVALGGGAVYDPQLFRAAEGKVGSTLSAEKLFDKGKDLVRGFIEKDPYKGYAYIKAAADMGLPDAMAEISKMYIDPIYGLDDADASRTYADRAIAKYKELAEQNDEGACLTLGDCYYRGELGCDKNIGLAWKYYKLGADLGNMHCLRYCGEICEARGDYAMAARYYQKSADKGNNMAAYALANMYAEGRGVARDRAKAIQLYQRCANDRNWTCWVEAEQKLKYIC